MDNKAVFGAVAAAAFGAGYLLHSLLGGVTREVVVAPKAPSAIGPYSVAVKAGGMVYVSGMIGLDPATGRLVEGGVEAQTRQALANMEAVLAAAGSGAGKVVKAVVLLRTMDDYAAVNVEYAKVFVKDPPARAAFAVAGLPANALVEIAVDATL